MQASAPSILRFRRPRGFTLMEVVVSIGILAVALSAIAGTISYGSRRGAETSRKVQAGWLLDGMVADLRDAMPAGRTRTALHELDVPAAAPAELEYFFDAEGIRTEGAEGSFFRCRFEFRPDDSGAALIHLNGRISWPALAKKGREQGSVELVSTIFRP
jgi:prepilin-type N-terminal cleavage/methylation domain-containing protein